MRKLADSIRLHQRRYYIENNPTITDREFDRLLEKLQELEAAHPELMEPNSPTRLVGSDLEESFEKFTHRIPVLSLANTYSTEEALEWAEKISRNEEELFHVQWKVDGATLVLYYEEGHLIRAVTRGSGQVGDVVTANALTIRNIPHALGEAKNLQVRGEVYMTYRDFEDFNERAGSLFANPRNLTSGSLKHKKSAEVATRPLRWIAFDVHGAEPPLPTEAAALDLARKIGLPVFQDNTCVPLKSLSKTIELFRKKKEEVPFPVDGLVLKLDDRRRREDLGFTAHSPRWATALKFEPEIGTTEVLEIETFVGRTGRVTPRARLKPVKLAGTTVSYATLHNRDFIERLGVRVGSVVKVSKRGEIIPAVEEVVDPGQGAPYLFPDRCPSCGTPLVRDEDAVDFLCPSLNCDEKKINGIIFFCARKQMDLSGLGEKVIRSLYGAGLISSIEELYTLHNHTEQIESMTGFGNKSVALILKGVQESLTRPFRKVLPSLGIRELGPAVTEILLGNGYHSMDSLYELVDRPNAKELLQEMDGIGPRTADLLVEELSRPEIRHQIEILKKAGLRFEEEAETGPGGPTPFLEQSWCVTGSFENFKPRDRAMELIRRGGGRVVSSVTGKTTHLLAGEEAGSKLEKARKLGVTVVSEKEFLEILKHAGIPAP